MANERKYIAIVELEEDSALREQWPFSGVCDTCIAWPCYEDCAINKFPITRQEAIERMVLAMHNEEIKRSIKDIPCDYRNLAEAALNAIVPMIPQEEQNER